MRAFTGNSKKPWTEFRRLFNKDGSMRKSVPKAITDALGPTKGDWVEGKEEEREGLLKKVRKRLAGAFTMSNRRPRPLREEVLEMEEIVSEKNRDQLSSEERGQVEALERDGSEEARAALEDVERDLTRAREVEGERETV